MTLEHRISYRPDIDGLRAIAVLMVLLVHAFPKTLPNGYIGVDVFFVISGYLITSILLRELGEQSFSIREFYVRRINRIFPSLLLVLVFVIVAGPLIMYPTEYASMGKSMIFSTLFSANVNFFLEAGYWDISSKLKPLLHLWSLGVEEQFYLVWPLVLLLFSRAKRPLLGVSIGVIALSLIVNLCLTAQNQAAGFYLPFGRFWELACGGLLACIQSKTASIRASASPNDVGDMKSPSVHDVLGWSGMGLLVAMLVVPMKAEAFPGFYAVPVIISTVLMIMADPASSFNRRVLSNRTMVYLGRISYPLYLWHWPLLVFGRLLGEGKLGSAHRNVAVVCAILLSMLSYHALERPLARRIARRNSLALALLLVMGGLSIVASLLYQGKFMPAYAHTSLLSYEEPQIASNGKVAILGDSNAGHLLYGLTLLYGQRLETFATPGWPYLDGVEYREGYVPHESHKGSPEATELALRRIESDADIRLVIISNLYPMYLSSDSLRSMKGGSSTETTASAYEEGLRRTIERLRASGKKVVFVKHVPTYNTLTTITACTEARPVFRKEIAGCIRSRATVESERRDYDALVARVVQGMEDVYLFNTLEELCDSQTCYVSKNGIQMYSDPSHLTPAGSQLVGAALARQVEMALSEK